MSIMMAKLAFCIFVSLAHMPWMILALTTEAVIRATTASDIYTEAPCELHPLSAYKDVQGNLWGIGDGNLWWFNSTNLSWSLLPMPNGTASSDPWKVVCVDPKKYVAIVGNNASLVLHLPWQHWQFSDTDDVDIGYVDKDATWCLNGHLYSVDPQRETLYLLDVEEARWTVQDNLSIVAFANLSAPSSGLVNSWIGYKNELIIVEKHGECDRVMYTNTTAVEWVVMAQKNSTNVWPNLEESQDGRSLAWKLGSNILWIWKEDRGNVKELWSFGYDTHLWKKASSKFVKELPSLGTVLTGWVDGDEFCVLKRGDECSSQYSISQTECWSENEMIAMEPSDPLNATTEPTNANVSDPGTEKIGQDYEKSDYTSTTHVLAPTTTEALSSSSRSNLIDLQTPMKPVITQHIPAIISADQDSNVVAIVPAKDPNWHQHSSVFGSVVFFGTSITIFTLFGIFYCFRKCVHFPKEALLLRDPPSVRYTAIPDSLGYDCRKPTQATYTVIPDSIA